MIRRIKSWWLKRKAYGNWLNIYNRFSHYTMMSDYLFADNLMLAETVHNIEGDVVECGVWRGGMSAGLATILNGNRHYYLFDSFEGMPKPGVEDGAKAEAWYAGKIPDIYYNNCKAEMEEAKQAMEPTGCAFTLVPGWFENTIPAFHSGNPIALLRLDADWYDSILICFEHLYPKVAVGGIILIDDYYSWDGCSRAVHSYLHTTNSRARIERSANGVAFIRKPPYE